MNMNPGSSNPSANPEAPSGSSQTSSAAASASPDKSPGFIRAAAANLDARREPAARGLHRVAERLRGRAESLPGGRRVASAANSTAKSIASVADYVRGNDVEDMVEDAQDVIKNNPTTSLLVAAAAGFLLVRAFARD